MNIKCIKIQATKISDNFDLLFSILAITVLVVALFFVIFINRPIYTIPICFTLIICIIWVCFREKFSLNELPTSACHYWVFLLLNILFFLFLMISIISIHFRPNLYERPLVYFILLSLLSCLVALEILFSPKNRKCISLILFQIIIIGLSTSWSQQIIFPAVIETDPWYHQMFTSLILQSSHIPDGYLYSKLPVFHLIIATASLITGLNYKFATMFSVGLSQILCNAIFIFLLGMTLFNNRKVALLSSLLLVIADRHIWMNYVTIPNSLGGVLILIIVYLLLKSLKSRKTESTLVMTLSIFFMLILILTHTISAAALAIILFISLIGSTFYNIFHRKKTIKFPAVFLILFAIFGLTMLAWWTFVSGHIEILKSLIQWKFSISRFAQWVPKKVLDHYTTVPSIEILYNSLGEIIFLGLSFVGIFYAISKKGTLFSFTIATIGTTLFAISYLSRFGFYIMQYRWVYFAQIFCAIPLAVSTLLIYNLIKNKNTKAIAFSMFIFFLTFVMITNNVATLDNDSFSPNSNVRLALTESELQSIIAISKIGNNTVGTDEYAFRAMNYKNYNATDISKELLNGDFEKCNRLVLIRDDISRNPIRMFKVNYKLNYDPIQVLISQEFFKIYDIGTVNGFYYP